MSLGSEGALDLALRVARLAVRIGEIDEVEPFVTAALERRDVGVAAARDPAEQGAELVAACLGQLPASAAENPMLLVLGGTPDPAQPRTLRTERTAHLASALRRATELQTAASAVVILALDGSEG